MKKLMLIGLIGAVAVIGIAKKTNVCSYTATFFSSVEKSAADQIPTKFELARIRHEINNLDGDISQMIKPIAEYKVTIEKLRKDITRSQANVDEQKQNLLAVVKELQGNPKGILVGHRVVPADRVRDQLQSDLDRVKTLEKHIRTQQQMLEAKESSLKATQEQLAKVIAKKREFEVRLAQLEAEDETLKVAAIGTTIQIDTSRATQIEEALAAVQHRLDVQRTANDLQTGNLNLRLTERTPPTATDLQTIRNYLEGSEPTEKTVNNK